MYQRPPSPTAPPAPFSPAGPPPARRRGAKNPALDTKLAQMALPLAPLVQLSTGRVHPDFPGSLLAFWLLTDRQLEALAHFYHQRSPGPLTGHYPCPVRWGRGLTLEAKRRKIGRFIGLRGCDSPLAPRPPAAAAAVLRAQTEEEIAEAARRARLREDEEEGLRRKTWYS